MPKRKLVVATPSSLDDMKVVNWEACCLCQSPRGDQLIQPSRNPIETRKNLGYKSLGENLQLLQKFNYMLPSQFSVNVLDEG